MKPFLVDIADLIHRPGMRRTERRVGQTASMRVAETLVPEGAQLQVEALLEPVGSGILATGWASVRWQSGCRRCAVGVSGTTRSEFQEEFDSAAGVDGDTYPMKHDQIDLELVSREAILLDLPLAPLCREDCAGLCPICGIDRNESSCSCEQSTADPRWAALDALSFPVSDPVSESSTSDDKPDSSA